jgi:hypothetical protein
MDLLSPTLRVEIIPNNALCNPMLFGLLTSREGFSAVFVKDALDLVANVKSSGIRSLKPIPRHMSSISYAC